MILRRLCDNLLGEFLGVWIAHDVKESVLASHIAERTDQNVHILVRAHGTEKHHDLGLARDSKRLAGIDGRLWILFAVMTVRNHGRRNVLKPRKALQRFRQAGGTEADCTIYAGNEPAPEPLLKIRVPDLGRSQVVHRQHHFRSAQSQEIHSGKHAADLEKWFWRRFIPRVD